MWHRATGFGDVVSTEKKPKVGYGKKEAKGVAPKRRQKCSSGDQGTQNANKGKSSSQEK